MRSAIFINTSPHAYGRGYRFYCAHLCTVQQKSSPSLANINSFLYLCRRFGKALPINTYFINIDYYFVSI